MKICYLVWFGLSECYIFLVDRREGLVHGTLALGANGLRLLADDALYK